MNNNIVKYRLQRIIFYLLMILLVIDFIGSIQVTYYIIKLRDFSNIMIFFMPIEIILYIIYKVINKEKITKCEVIIYLLFLCSLVSLIFSINKKVALFGFPARYEGLLTFYSYYAHILLASCIENRKDKNKIIGLILIIGLINVLYGLLQTKVIPNNLDFIIGGWYYARGFQGNSMYYATLVGMCYFMSLIYYLDSDKFYLPLFLVFIFSIGNILSGSMALLCTTIFIFILLIIREINEKRLGLFNKNRVIRLVFCILLFIILNVGFIFTNNQNEYKKDIEELNSQVASVTSGKKIEDTYGTGRGYIWKNTIKKIPENIFFGVGDDNFYYAFKPKLIDPVSKLVLDKAHNDYLQRLLCEGIFSTLFYIGLLGIVIFNNYKSRDLQRKILFLGFFSYIVEIFFSVSVIRVAPIFFIILGLLLRDDEKISVIVPIYNSKKYLKKCLDSIVNQTYDNLEIILVDDFSSDNSYEVCSKYLKDSRVILVKNKKNRGVSYSRNLGLKIASSRYVTFVDSDDYMLDDCIEYLYELKNKYKTKISIIAREKNKKNYEKKITQKEALKKMLSYDELELCVTGKLYNRLLFWNVSFPKDVLYEDIPVLGKILLKNKYIAFSTNQKYVYNRRSDSLTFKDYTKKDNDRSKLSFDLASKIKKKYPDLELYGRYFYICSLIAICNKQLLINYKDKSYIYYTRNYIKKYIKDILKLDISLIKKTQLLLFMISPRSYINVYKIVK